MAEGQDPLNPISELDPDRECDQPLFDPDTGEFIIQKFPAISPCKNNCRGGKHIMKSLKLC